MAFFILCSDITIGTFRFRGVHNVRVKRSMHSYADSAVITLPSICKITRGKRSTVKTLTTAKQFNEGDPVIINLGYNHHDYTDGDKTPVIKGVNNPDTDGFMCTVFQGFVKRLNLNMPLEIECEGYVRKLRQDVNIKKSYDKVKVSDLLKLLETDKDGKPTGIKTEIADDINLINVKLPNNNGMELIETVKRMSLGVLNIYFKEPATLWCGLTYAPYRENRDPLRLGEVEYKLGYNVVKDNSLKQREASKERIKIVIGNTDGAGKKTKHDSADKDAKQEKKVVINNVTDAADLKKMVTEMQYKANYSGYEGSISSFLQPWCEPGWIVNIYDKRYPDRDGKYMAEATEVTFGIKGARIKVDIGPRLGFDPNPKKI